MYYDDDSDCLDLLSTQGSNSSQEWQRKVEKLVKTRRIPYREAKRILREQQRKERQEERERRREEKQTEMIQRQEFFFNENPDFKFNEIMLRWDNQQGFIDYHDEYGQDQEKYIPFILEEANATLQQAWEKIDKTKRNPNNPYKFDFEIIETTLKKYEGLGSHTFKAMVKSELPKDLEGISLIALRIEVSGKPIDGASIVLASFDKNNLTQFTGRYNRDVETFAIKKGKIRQAYFLGSLITYQRMYVACKKNYGSFSRQIFSLKADRLNGFQSSSTTGDDCLQHLNQQQKSIAMNYINSSPGLYLLQGPPGTGKTTTICGILDYLYKENFRTLVTAPSNKAVQVIAKKFLQYSKESEQKIIIIGVPGKIDPALEKVFLDKLVDTFNRFKIKLSQLNLSKVLEINTKTIFFNVIKEIKECLNNRWLCDQSDYEEIKNNFDRLQEEFNKLLEDKKDIKQQNKYQHQYSLTQDLVNKKIDLSAIGSEQLEIKLLKAANIVFSTLSTSGRAYMISNNIDFDHLIVDEAAQSVIPEMFIPLHTKPKRSLMVGDPQQLPATIISLENKKKYGEDFSLMHQMFKHGSYIEMLITQYRMHPEIRQWPASKYYEDKLVDDKSISARKSILSSTMRTWCKPWAFYNVCGQEKLWVSSFYNERESAFIFSLVKNLNENNIYNNMINIITFYSAQKEQIEIEFNKEKRLYPKINTVDSFQGAENDVIIVSFVRANREARTGFLDSFRRLNVALTRGKHLLLMIGDQQTLQNSDSSDLKDLINDAEKRRVIFHERYVREQWRLNTPNPIPRAPIQVLPCYNARQHQRYYHNSHQQLPDSSQKISNQRCVLKR